MFPFIIGCPRSGTTLVRVMLNEHPELAVFPESRFVTRYARHRGRWELADGFDAELFARDVATHEKARQWRLDPKRLRRELPERAPVDFPSAVRVVFEIYAEEHGKPRYGDKTPTYVVDVPLLAALFDDAGFVHVIRDGRDVALSLVENRFGPTSPAEGILYWRRRVERAREATCALDAARSLAYRHEDLIDDPEEVLGRVCGFIGLGWDDGMLRYHEGQASRTHYGSRNLDKPPSRLRDWREQMPPDQQRLCEILAGDLLTDLGYELVTRPGGGEASLRRRADRIRARHQIWEDGWHRRVNRPPRAPIAGAPTPASTDPEAD